MVTHHLKLFDIIQAFAELGGEANWSDAKARVISKRGNGFAPYKDWNNYENTMFQFVQQHCEGYSKFNGDTRFVKVRGTRFRLTPSLFAAPKLYSLSPENHPETVPEDSDYITGEVADKEEYAESVSILTAGLTEPTVSELSTLIRDFNEKYRSADISRRSVISEQIARPSLISDYLKRLQGYTCQLCKEVGFMQSNGIRYIEAHHIVELNELIEGSYCSDNIIVVCANCHRKLHFAKVQYERLDGKHAAITINGQRFEFIRNVIS